MAPYTKDSRRAVNSSRHQVEYVNPMLTGSMDYDMSLDNVQYSSFETPYYTAVYSY